MSPLHHHFVYNTLPPTRDKFCCGPGTETGCNHEVISCATVPTDAGPLAVKVTAISEAVPATVLFAHAGNGYGKDDVQGDWCTAGDTFVSTFNRQQAVLRDYSAVCWFVDNRTWCMGITAACGRSLLQAQDLREADEAAGRSTHKSTHTPLDTTLLAKQKWAAINCMGPTRHCTCTALRCTASKAKNATAGTIEDATSMECGKVDFKSSWYDQLQLVLATDNSSKTCAKLAASEEGVRLPADHEELMKRTSERQVPDQMLTEVSHQRRRQHMEVAGVLFIAVLWLLVELGHKGAMPARATCGVMIFVVLVVMPGQAHALQVGPRMLDPTRSTIDRGAVGQAGEDPTDALLGLNGRRLQGMLRPCHTAPNISLSTPSSATLPTDFGSFIGFGTLQGGSRYKLWVAVDSDGAGSNAQLAAVLDSSSIFTSGTCAVCVCVVHAQLNAKVHSIFGMLSPPYQLHMNIAVRHDHRACL